VFVNHLCEAKGEQDGEADEAQESFALTELRDFLSYFVLRYCSLFCCTDDTTYFKDGQTATSVGSLRMFAGSWNASRLTSK